VDARAFMPPLDEVFKRLIENLEEIRLPPEEAERLEELTTELDALREAHEGDQCVRYKWLAKRTDRFMDRAAVTLKQYQRLTGRRHPGMVNILPGDLVPWEIAVDETADAMRMTSDEFAGCVVRAYERERTIFRTLGDIKELVR